MNKLVGLAIKENLLDNLTMCMNVINGLLYRTAGLSLFDSFLGFAIYAAKSEA